MSEQPAWLSDNSAPPPPPPTSSSSSSSGGGGKGGIFSSINNTSLPAILRIMRFGNFIVASGMIVLCVFQFLSFPNFEQTVTAVYGCFLGVVIIIFECQCGFTEETLRENFGFLFSFRGRLLFLVFCALLNFGFGIGGYIVGISMILMAIFNAYVIFAHPEFTTKLGSGSDPTNGSKTAEQLAQERAAEYAKNNPEQVASWAAQAANTGVGKENV